MTQTLMTTDNATMIMDDDGFQCYQPKNSSMNQRKQQPRIYVGNLPLDVNSTTSLENSIEGYKLKIVPKLIDFIHEKVNMTLASDDIEIVVGDNETLQQQPPETSTTTTTKNRKVHAYITIANMNMTRIDQTIRALNRSNLDGNMLLVRRERMQPSTTTSTTNNSNKKYKNNNNPATPSFSSNWSKPRSNQKNIQQNVSQAKQNTLQQHRLNDNKATQSMESLSVSNEKNDIKNDNSPVETTTIPMDEVIEKISDIVSNELNEQSNDDDIMNTAIAAIASVSLVASTMRYTVRDEHSSNKNNKAAASSVSNTGTTEIPFHDVVDSNIDYDKDRAYDENENESESDFFTRMNKTSMDDLIKELGEQDTNWMNQKVIPDPIDDGDDDDAINILNDDNTDEIIAENCTDTMKIIYENRLLRHGKAPIHIELVSFGYHHGIPSSSSSGWSYTHPLVPYDCRHLPEVPQYLSWMDGLSGTVKNALLRLSYTGNRDNNTNQNKNNSRYRPRRMNNDVDKTKTIVGTDNNNSNDKTMNINHYSRNTIANDVADIVQEAIDVGGYGYSLPLRMVIHVGSDTGRHRSVVCCELAARAIRKLLRTNDKNRFQQPCSVGCFHRELVNNNNADSNRKKNKKEGPVGPIRNNTAPKKKGAKDILDESV